MALAILAAYTAVTTASIVIHAYSPVLFGDQWRVIEWLQPDNHITAAKLWQQHNEHRNPIGRLVAVADLFSFGARNVSLILEILLIQILHGVLLVWVTRRYGGLPAPLFATAAAWIAYCTLSPLQMENFTWGFQGPFVLVGLCASACFAAAVYRAGLPEHAVLTRRFALAACLVAAFLSEASLSNGLLAWPLLLVLAAALGFVRRELLVILAIAAAAIAVYLAGYHSPSYHAQPLDSIRHPEAIARYAVIYLAASWDPSLPSDSAWPAASECLTALSMAFVAVLCLREVFYKKEKNRLRLFLLADMVFVVLTAVVTALGRINFGYWQATSSRYQSIALIYWGCLAALLIDLIKSRGSAWWPIAILQATLLGLLVSAASNFGDMRDWAMNRKHEVETGYFAMEHDPSNRQAAKAVYPVDEPNFMTWYAYLRHNGWAPDIEFPVAVVARGEAGNAAGYRVVAGQLCGGGIEKAEPASNASIFQVTGWAIDAQKYSAPGQVIITSADGDIAGVATPSIQRDDLADSFVRRPYDWHIGWSTTLKLPSNGKYRAFAILQDSQSACPLNNELLTGK